MSPSFVPTVSLFLSEHLWSLVLWFWGLGVGPMDSYWCRSPFGVYLLWWLSVGYVSACAALSYGTGQGGIRGHHSVWNQNMVNLHLVLILQKNQHTDTHTLTRSARRGQRGHERHFFPAPHVGALPPHPLQKTIGVPQFMGCILLRPHL